QEHALPQALRNFQPAVGSLSGLIFTTETRRHEEVRHNVMIRIAVLSFALLFSGALFAEQRHRCAGTGHGTNGRATDVDQIGGKPVSDYDKDPEVKQLVDAYQAKLNRTLPTPAENYGPAGLYRGGKKIKNAKLAANHTDHIHMKPAQIKGR